MSGKWRPECFPELFCLVVSGARMGKCLGFCPARCMRCVTDIPQRALGIWNSRAQFRCLIWNIHEQTRVDSTMRVQSYCCAEKSRLRSGNLSPHGIHRNHHHQHVVFLGFNSTLTSVKVKIKSNDKEDLSYDLGRKKKMVMKQSSLCRVSCLSPCIVTEVLFVVRVIICVP
jgi:hypothetical protein